MRQAMGEEANTPSPLGVGQRARKCTARRMRWATDEEGGALGGEQEG